MKTSVAVLAAAATVAMAKPEFLNTNFDITAGEPFTLKFSGCDDGCKIVLVNGDPEDLQVVQTLEEDTTSDEYVLRLSDNFETDKYAFVITDSDGEVNYSEQWDFVGAEPAETSAEETSTVAETSTAEETSTEAETTSVEETTMVTVTTDTETMTTPESTTETDSPSSTDDSDNSEETGDDSAPDDEDAAVRLGSSHVTLAAVVVAAFGYFL